MATPDRPNEDELDFRHLLHIATRRKWTIVTAVVLVAGSALGLSLLQPRVYQGDARLVLQADQAETIFNPQTGQRNDPERLVSTEIQIMRSQPVRDMVEKKIGDARSVSASSIGQTDVISVRARDGDAKRAALVANTYAEMYVQYKQQRAVAALLQAASEITKQVNSLQSQVDDLDRQIQSGAGEDARIQRNSLIEQIGTFRSQLDQVEVQSRLKGGGAQVVTPAEVPSDPVEPTPRRNTVLGALLGLMAGVGIAFLREQFDESIRSKDDVERISHGLPVLSLIPRSERAKEGIVALSDPNSPAAESYRSLRTSVQFAGLDKEIKILQATSPSQSEGKTTTLANLAVTLANAGLRVTVVCCDLRRPRIHELFGVTNLVGFTSVLLGNAQLNDALQPIKSVPRLKILASGPPPPNPSELLSHPRTGELLASLAAQNDIVLVDSPPILPVTDSLVLSRWVDGTFVVVAANQTTRKALARTLELAQQVNAPIVGTVLNGVTTGAGGYGYGNGYGYGYGGTYEATPTNSNGSRKKSAARK